MELLVRARCHVCKPLAPATRRWRPPGAAQPYAVYVDERDVVWLSDFAASAIVRFDPASQRFTTLRLRAGPSVRQLLGRPGELWGAESGPTASSP